MKTLCCLFACLGLAGPAHAGTDEWFDRVSDNLTYSGNHDALRARLIGTLDLEEYWFQTPAPQLLYAEKSPLFNARLSLFLDAQIGPRVYVFAQARVDRGFDPADEKLTARLDEYALRFAPVAEGRLQIQFGKFGTVIGNWIRRHGSWDDPFITAPIPYSQLTGIWDVAPAESGAELLQWSHLARTAYPVSEYEDKELRLPVIWGPSYTHGVSIAGRAKKFEYAAEMKSGALASRPSAWDAGQIDWKHPTFNAELSYRPSPLWNAGVSLSSGPYLRPSATRSLRSGYGLASYREVVLGQDFEFAWHHFQLWSEIYHARFENPAVGNASLTAYYIEAKYKFTPQCFAALRWNQEIFGDVFIPSRGWVKWGRDTWRIDFAPTYRYNAHLQLKLQYTLQHQTSQERNNSQTVALQLTTRF